MGEGKVSLVSSPTHSVTKTVTTVVPPFCYKPGYILENMTKIILKKVMILTVQYQMT